MNTPAINTLRHITSPDHPNRQRIKLGRKALTILPTIIACILTIITGQYLVSLGLLALGITVLFVESEFLQRAGAWGIPAEVSLIATPWAAVLALLVAPQSKPLAFLFFLGIMAAGILWDWNPWIEQETKKAQAKAGWGYYIPRRLGFIPLHDQSMNGLLQRTDINAWRHYQPELARQLEELGAQWEIHRGRWNTDAIAVGPTGVVGVHSVDLTGHKAIHINTSQDEALVRKAQFSVRYHPLALDAATRNAPVQVMEFESEFINENGEDLGILLSAGPTQNMTYLGKALVMPEGQTPVTLLIAHGLDMDKRWGRVHTYDNQGQWAGIAMLCHPLYVGDCIAQLPGVFANEQQIEGAQIAVDLRTR